MASDKELFNREHGLRKELFELEKHIENSKKLKEIEFSKLKAFNNEVKKLSEDVKGIKSENDKNSLNFFELKEERDKYNNESKKLIEEVKKLRKKYNALSGGEELTNPENILKTIEDLELKIETEGYDFEKEKAVMENIKLLKSQYEGNKELFKLYNEIKSISKNIDEMQKKADECHKNFVEMREKNKAEYEKFFSLVKKINALRKESNKIFKEYKKHKTNYTANLGIYNIKKREFDLIEQNIKNTKTRKLDIKLRNQKEIIAKKAVKVEEKLKKGDKLTNEDLLILRGLDNA